MTQSIEKETGSSTPMRIYSAIEFTINGDDRRLADFGKDMLRMIQTYDDILIGYHAEDVDGDDINILCDDADADWATACIKQIFGIGRPESDSRDGI